MSMTSVRSGLFDSICPHPTRNPFSRVSLSLFFSLTQGYLVHKKHPRPWEHYMTLRICYSRVQGGGGF